MKLRYSGNMMPFEDSMKKVAAITWAPSGKKVAACIPMHTFGFPVEIDTIIELCNQYNNV